MWVSRFAKNAAAILAPIDNYCRWLLVTISMYLNDSHGTIFYDTQVVQMKVMLDTNIFDKLLADVQNRQLIRCSIAAGTLELFMTSVQLNEIGKVLNEGKRKELFALISELCIQEVPVEYAPYGYSYGECYGGRSPELTLDTEKFVTSDAHISDAMIAATASSLKYKMDFVVTEDRTFQGKLKKQDAKTIGISYDHFVGYIHK